MTDWKNFAAKKTLLPTPILTTKILLNITFTLLKKVIQWLHKILSGIYNLGLEDIFEGYLQEQPWKHCYRTH